MRQVSCTVSQIMVTSSRSKSAVSNVLAICLRVVLPL